MEVTPPELSADIIEKGILMTGGGALLHGMDKLIKSKTGINAMVSDDSVSCVAIGTGRYIEFLADGGGKGGTNSKRMLFEKNE